MPGASDLAKAAIGFNRSKREGDDEEAINRLFSPEFRNRLDAVITFANLSPEVICAGGGEVRVPARGAA